MQPLAGPYHEFLCRDLCCYLRNNPATSPKKSDRVIHPVSFARLGFPDSFFYMRFAVCALFYIKVNQKAFSKSAICLSSAAEPMLCLQVIKIPLDVSLY